MSRVCEVRVGGPRSPGDGPWQEPWGHGGREEDRAAPRAQLAGLGGRVKAARAAAWTAARGLRGLPCPRALPLALQTQAEKFLDHLHSRQEGGSPALVSRGGHSGPVPESSLVLPPQHAAQEAGGEDRQQQACAASRGGIPPRCLGSHSHNRPRRELIPPPPCLRHVSEVLAPLG